MNPKIEKIVDYFWVVGVNNELVTSNKKQISKNSIITDLELVKMDKEDEEIKLISTK